MINEIAEWTSGFVGETSGYSIPESGIVISIAAVFIVFRIGLGLRNKKMTNISEGIRL